MSVLSSNCNYNNLLCDHAKSQILFEGWVFAVSASNHHDETTTCNETELWVKQWLVLYKSTDSLHHTVLSSFHASNIYVDPIHSLSLSSDFQVTSTASMDTHNHYRFTVQCARTGIVYASPCCAAQQEWLKHLNRIRKQVAMFNAHKMLLLTHTISHYLLPYEQHRIARLNKSVYHRICDKSIYTAAHFVRDAMYFAKYHEHALRHGHNQHAMKFDFVQTLQSLQVSELMQLKYNVIYLDKINAYIMNCNESKHRHLDVELCSLRQHSTYTVDSATASCTDVDLVHFVKSLSRSTAICVERLDFASFIKPQMLMMEEYHSYSSAESDDETDDECVCDNDTQSVLQLDRLKYICDILQFTDFHSAYNTIKHINLRDNNLNNEDLCLLLDAMKANKRSEHFTNIQSIDLSGNWWIGSVGDEKRRQCVDAVWTALFEVIASKFPNLRELNLSETGATDLVLAAIAQFRQRYKSHPLQVINVQHCEDLIVSDHAHAELTTHADSTLCVLYDRSHTPSEHALPTLLQSVLSVADESEADGDLDDEFEFGYDCRQIDDDESKEDEHLPKMQQHSHEAASLSPSAHPLALPMFDVMAVKSMSDAEREEDGEQHADEMETGPLENNVSLCSPRSHISEFTDDDGFVYLDLGADDQDNDDDNDDDIIPPIPASQSKLDLDGTCMKDAGIWLFYDQ